MADGDNNSVDSELKCRICLSNEVCGLIKACNCSGTIGLVHAPCLEHWTSVSSRLFCEICKCEYRGERNPKYGAISSVIPFILCKWNWKRILVFVQVSLLFVLLNVEVFSVENADFPKSTSLFIFWCLFTYNFLFYFIAYTVISTVECWIKWRKTQIVFTSAVNGGAVSASSEPGRDGCGGPSSSSLSVKLRI